MNSEKVKVTVRGNDSVIETVGEIRHEGNRKILTYDDNTLFIGTDEIRLVESGEAKTDILFRADGIKKPVSYDTGFGIIKLDVLTYELSVREEGDRTEIRLVYDLAERTELFILLTKLC